MGVSAPVIRQQGTVAVQSEVAHTFAAFWLLQLGAVMKIHPVGYILLTAQFSSELWKPEPCLATYCLG